ncbi:App1 family protein (plasmid) [Roseobacteraceae bacterium NS-SX3]
MRAERALDAIFRRRNGTGTGVPKVIDPYLGFATPDQLIVRGRVLTKLRHGRARENQSLLANLRQMVSLFLTDEVSGVTVCHGGTTAISDEEGYFQLPLPNRGPAGWRDIPVSIEGRGKAALCPVLVPRPDARFMVISDIDDTMMRTGAYSLWRNLWTSFTGNALTRHVFPDSVALMQHLSEGGRNPVFYVSSSPWNMHGFLDQVFRRAGLVRGPMFLRDLGLSETKFITEGHGNHKGQSIDTLLRAHPGLPAVLIGDTGQHDAAIYLEAAQRHPGRIAAVLLRTPGNGADAADLQDLAALEETGVPVLAGQDFNNALTRLAPADLAAAAPAAWLPR